MSPDRRIAFFAHKVKQDGAASPGDAMHDVEFDVKETHIAPSISWHGTSHRSLWPTEHYAGEQGSATQVSSLGQASELAPEGSVSVESPAAGPTPWLDWIGLNWG